jgi:glycosyltransferase involved in cell wall biosynthesis
MAAPEVTIVVPVYNEEGILREAVSGLVLGWANVRAELGRPDLGLEIIIAENGSRDGTVAAAEHLATEFPEVRTFSLGEPNYGKALRAASSRRAART